MKCPSNGGPGISFRPFRHVVPSLMSPQLGLRSLQDLAPEMRLAMASDLEDEEGPDGETTGDEVFDSEAGTSVNTTPATTPLPPIDALVRQTAILVEPEPTAEKEEVITEQVKGLQEESRPGSELAGVSVVTEQPARSEPLPVIRCVPLLSRVLSTPPSPLTSSRPVPAQGGLRQRPASSSSASDVASPGGDGGRWRRSRSSRCSSSGPGS